MSLNSPKRRLLFVCGRNKRRSPTAEKVFSTSNEFEARSRGLSSSATRRVTAADIRWADAVFVMVDEQRAQLNALFRAELADTEVYVLDIPDEYEFMDPELVELIETGVSGSLERH